MNYYEIRLKNGYEESKDGELSVPVMAENETEAIKALMVAFAKVVVFEGSNKFKIAFDGKDMLTATNNDDEAKMKIVSITPLFKEMENGGFSLSLEAKEE